MVVITSTLEVTAEVSTCAPLQHDLPFVVTKGRCAMLFSDVSLMSSHVLVMSSILSPVSMLPQMGATHCFIYSAA